jgi:proteasome assembly chaperone (PAC2) family protein
MRPYRIIKHEELNPESLINPICIIGMPGIADIGKFAVDQLIGVFQAKKYCEIIFYDYPAGAIVEESILSTPKAEILFYSDPKKKQDIFLITADAQAMTPRGVYEISDLLATLIHRLKIERIIALGGNPVKKPTKADKAILYATSTNEEDLYDLFEQGCKPISKGVIIGSNGLIPTLMKARFNTDAVVILAETDNAAVMNENITDLQASIDLLEFVSTYYHLPIKSDFSSQKMDEISKDLDNKRKELESEMEPFQPPIEYTEVNKSLYI